jgi:RNA 2',3'-cyclic 3'-phosphodiesterase
MLVALDAPSLPSEPQAPVGLFFAVFPDPRSAARIQSLAQHLRREHGFKGRPLLASRFHCSLYGFDDRDGAWLSVVAKAQEAAAIVPAAPFRVSFNCVKSFSGRTGHYPLVLVGEDGVVGLTRFYSSLCTAMRKVGLRPRRCTNFTPHLTMLYDSRRIGEQLIEPIFWTVSEVVLVLSLTGRTKYFPLQRWQLRGIDSVDAESVPALSADGA